MVAVRRIIKTMVTYARREIPVVIGKGRTAVGRIRVEEPQRVAEVGKPPTVYRPVRNIVMMLLGRHVGYALLLISRTLELPRRVNNVWYSVVPAVLTRRNIDPVHDYRRDGLHALIALAARLALNKPCQQL